MMKASIWIALGVTACLSAWMLSGSLIAQPSPATEPAKVAPAQSVRVKVQTRQLQAQPVTREVVALGQLEPLRHVQIRAETEGRIMRVLVAKGQRVNADTLCLQLSMETRQSSLKEAEALLRQRRKELDSAQRLKIQGLQAENTLLEAQAALASAQAALAQIQLDIEHTHIRAPFAGIINERLVEEGDFVQRGDVLAVLVDDSVLKISGQVAQQNLQQLKIGQNAQAELLGGRILQGRISYLSAIADANTRSFRVEMQAPNPNKLAAGASATLRIPVETTRGYFMSSAMLALSDSGELGAKAVDSDHRVVFYPLDILRTSTDGLWVSGLPEQVNLITLGQGFVQAGEVVEAIPES